MHSYHKYGSKAKIKHIDCERLCLVRTFHEYVIGIIVFGLCGSKNFDGENV